MKRRVLIIFLVFILVFILGCDVPDNPLNRNNQKEDKPSSDLMEFSKDLGDLFIKLIVRPGKDRISIQRDINLGFEVQNKGERDISFTYSIVDTPADSYGGIQRGELTGSYIIESGEKELVDSLLFQYNNEQLRQTQFLLDLQYTGFTKFTSSSNICLKDSLNENVGISCSSETVEKGESSNSAVKINRVEKFLVDNDFDGSTDELIFKISTNIDSDCELDLENNPSLIKIESFDAVGFTGFDCSYNKNTKKIDCGLPISINQEFVEGPLNIVFSYKCKVTLSTGSINLNKPSRIT